ncbi:hypothetical protein XMV201_000782 [Aliiroseovarius sp. xm-v-201]|nr:hypothetical protein [Aliiroseovarius sp. xm-m-314]NRP78584.1 hypothetical protein [Aliiroseovarius sp. xm-v-209]NRQ03786.1 hypothetical protein [Aliiroseovarius sp. xm-m-309]NRQ06990.1 hypothetical protein [Aliiroseovarius sp. xm-v-201]NRQ09591.1 hypothetical protein [Aliiroseovarius sp. xm-v-208]
MGATTLSNVFVLAFSEKCALTNCLIKDFLTIRNIY